MLGYGPESKQRTSRGSASRSVVNPTGSTGKAPRRIRAGKGHPPTPEDTMRRFARVDIDYRIDILFAFIGGIGSLIVISYVVPALIF